MWSSMIRRDILWLSVALIVASLGLQAVHTSYQVYTDQVATWDWSEDEEGAYVEEEEIDEREESLTLEDIVGALLGEEEPSPYPDEIAEAPSPRENDILNILIQDEPQETFSIERVPTGTVRGGEPDFKDGQRVFDSGDSTMSFPWEVPDGFAPEESSAVESKELLWPFEESGVDDENPSQKELAVEAALPEMDLEEVGNEPSHGEDLDGAEEMSEAIEELQEVEEETPIDFDPFEMEDEDELEETEALIDEAEDVDEEIEEPVDTSMEELENLEGELKRIQELENLPEQKIPDLFEDVPAPEVESAPEASDPLEEIFEAADAPEHPVDEQVDSLDLEMEADSFFFEEDAPLENSEESVRLELPGAPRAEAAPSSGVNEVQRPVAPEEEEEGSVSARIEDSLLDDIFGEGETFGEEGKGQSEEILVEEEVEDVVLPEDALGEEEDLDQIAIPQPMIPVPGGEEVSIEAIKEAPEAVSPRPELTQTDGNRYRLRIGDRLFVTIYGERGTGQTVTVDSTGHISYLLVGSVFALGKTIDELRQILDAEIRKTFRFAFVTVTPVEFGGQYYTILGEVRKPGKKLLASKTTLLEALCQAGGFSTGSFRSQTIDLADLRHAFLVRKGEYLPVDFERLVIEGDLSIDVDLKNGDYIYVPSSLYREISILGEVNSPTTIGFLNTVSVVEALSQARGITSRASSRAIIIRGALSHPERFVVDINRILKGFERDFLLQPGDILYVPPFTFTSLKDVIKGGIRAFVSTVGSIAGSRTFGHVVPDADGVDPVFVIPDGGVGP